MGEGDDGEVVEDEKKEVNDKRKEVEGNVEEEVVVERLIDRRRRW